MTKEIINNALSQGRLVLNYTEEKSLGLWSPNVNGSMGLGRYNGNQWKVGDYVLRRIGSYGNGNQGSVIVCGATPRTCRVVRNIKIKKLIAQGVCEKIAKHAVCSKWGAELAVAKLAEEIEKMTGIMARPVSKRDWDIRTGIKTSLSYPRRMAAWDIANMAQN